jgi:hypothetical protein
MLALPILPIFSVSEAPSAYKSMLQMLQYE